MIGPRLNIYVGGRFTKSQTFKVQLNILIQAGYLVIVILHTHLKLCDCTELHLHTLL